MKADTELKYVTKAVRAVRGMESRTIKKWEAEGWEVVAQIPGKLKTEITLRRPAPRWSRRLIWIAAGGVLAVALVSIIVAGVIGEKNEGPVESDASAPPGASAWSGRATPRATSTATTSSSAPKDAVLTRENSPELAALLELTDTCSPDIAAFAEVHRGQTISFQGSIVAIAPHGSAKTRYDILINTGDFSPTIARPGPNFQFRDENVSYDFHWVGQVPDTVGVGTNLSITAEVDRYIEKQCLFLLEPVATAVR
ncbi:DUF4839 domain-containing protein [Williamsia herbipolensis]|uniref:DUF4839 domain-containing protein n=1 Tax=Williamsia herbipolensis TaxID=1603258 RepID=A0AAU4JZ47_9NOCA|nr:DUF4839 domain-containing protein [Williamsia herbipolensis]